VSRGNGSAKNLNRRSQMSRRANSLQSLFRGNWSGVEADPTLSLDIESQEQDHSKVARDRKANETC
jgi:hypothetical protein